MKPIMKCKKYKFVLLHTYLPRRRLRFLFMKTYPSLSFQYYEMSYGLNVEMHKQTEIGKRLDAIIRQVLPFLSGEHQQQVAMAVERAKQITMAELNAVMQVNTSRKSD